MSERARVARLSSTIRLRILSTRDWIDNCKNAKGRDVRPPEWFTEMRGVLRDLEAVRDELEFIEAHAPAYEAWKASVSSGGQAA